MPIHCELQFYYQLGTDITSIGHDHIAIRGARSSSDLLLLTGILTSLWLAQTPFVAVFHPVVLSRYYNITATNSFSLALSSGEHARDSCES